MQHTGHTLLLYGLKGRRGRLSGIASAAHAVGITPFPPSQMHRSMQKHQSEHNGKEMQKRESGKGRREGRLGEEEQRQQAEEGASESEKALSWDPPARDFLPVMCTPPSVFILPQRFPGLIAYSLSIPARGGYLHGPTETCPRPAPRAPAPAAWHQPDTGDRG